ncbi:MAG: MoaD/ThiS family protein [Bacteroidetes bacterium]|nr:MoaD/ThiS family protein [Rhodothermia bacterium]MCS7155278.1 MoaD/ThiS family protein [Bacteroidota bacterium]MCX7907863.1 MoaD/ThiS family protein [Bacteroidota bacterium]MDW8138682.1 MoaD/ThiS family protein [Bacteroidota bacterium]MDW8284732.1 MoaD/ThiS family protein [Bacteroidota bacterium]
MQSRTLRIRIFGPLQDLFGVEALELPDPGPTTVAQLWALLEARYPDLASWRPLCRMAVGGRCAHAETPVTADDELALLPPVSGG